MNTSEGFENLGIGLLTAWRQHPEMAFPALFRDRASQAASSFNEDPMDQLAAVLGLTNMLLEQVAEVLSGSDPGKDAAWAALIRERMGQPFTAEELLQSYAQALRSKDK